MLVVERGSLSINKPYANTPTMPIPVHTAYAILRGMVLVASHRKTILKIIEIITKIKPITIFYAYCPVYLKYSSN